MRLFQQWKDLISRMKSIEPISTIYSEAKQSAMDYQTAKMEVSHAFEKNGLGRWIVTILSNWKKPSCFLF